MAVKLTIDTTSPGYTTRRQEWTDAVNYIKPAIRQWFRMNQASQEEWLPLDPFLQDVFKLVDAVNQRETEE